MTVLSAIQKAAPYIGQEELPSYVYSSTDPDIVELGLLANRVARDIAESYDWQVLKTLATITGNGTTTAFDFEDDYERMLKKGNLWSSRLDRPYSPITDSDRWLEYQVRDFQPTIGMWTIYGNQIHFMPAPTSGETLKYWYISNLIVSPETGDNKATFTLDSDVFLLNENLLTLGMKYQWRSDNGLQYAQEKDDYETLLDRLITADKGPRVLTMGRPRMPKDVTIAYPFAVE